MKTFTVRWEIEIEAPSAWSAALQAREIQKEVNGIGCAFDIQEHRSNHVAFFLGPVEHIDLYTDTPPTQEAK